MTTRSASSTTRPGAEQALARASERDWTIVSMRDELGQRVPSERLTGTRETVVGLFSSLQGYRPEWLRGDLIAGLTVWAVLVPEALAYASIAGVSPVVGLYAAPGRLPALRDVRQLASSHRGSHVRHPAASSALPRIRGHGRYLGMDHFIPPPPRRSPSAPGSAGLVAALLRLGFLTNFISEPVLKGFIVGLALTIIVGQLPELFGYPWCLRATSSRSCAGVLRELGSS